MDAELIFCEDTRVTKKLLSLLGEKNNLDFSNKEYKSYHSHNEKKVLETLTIETFTKNVVYVSDAGMPCVSDPGATLVDYCIQNNIKYDVLPGANAVLTAYAMSGFTHTTFSFHGFLDHKLASLYESPHRLANLLEELNKLVPNRTIFLAKEITKLHQRTYKNSASNLYEEFKSINIRGEWVVVIEPSVITGSAIELKDIQDLDLPPKIKAKLISKLTGQSTKEVYQQILDKI